MKRFLVVTAVFFYAGLSAQKAASPDSISELKPVLIHLKKFTPERLPVTQDHSIFSGKKNEIIRLSNINANFTTNNVREIFSRIPGVTVWENEGSGIQINVGVRGLSPNRSWELNTRQNGYDISSDVFGYPEAYYNPPMEAVESIQLVRGGASLQFGPQFGGMLNYVLKRETQKKFSFETQNTTGSYGLFSSYNAIGGTVGKFSYYAYNHYRRADGWRENSSYDINNTHAFLGYAFSDRTKLTAEYTRMNYNMQQAGGLTDEQFRANPQQSSRSRNWFGTPWNILSLNLETHFSPKWSSTTRVFGLLGERNSVGFTAAPNTLDAQDASGNFAPRRVDRDFYRNIGLENRNLVHYTLANREQHLSFGVRLYQAETRRQQEGRGTTGDDFSLFTSAAFPRDLDFVTKNVALFAENAFRLTNRLTVTPGIRYEHITSLGDGRFATNADGSVVPLPQKTLVRNQILLGVGTEYQLGTTNIYANISQAFRPVLFSDLTPPAVTDVIDPNLRDADGFNADLGYRGTFRNMVNFDVSLFYLQYNNRIGGVRQFVNNDPTQGTFLYRTNLGETIHKGIESFVSVSAFRALGLTSLKGNLDVFATMSFIDARYSDFAVTTASGTAPNISITTSNLRDNRVENAPRYIHNFGASYSVNGFSATLQHRITGRIFTDANNTVQPSANGITGLLDKYQVTDFAAEYRFWALFNVRAGVNNLFDERYATRRAGGYPGPGILPGEGRTWYVSLGFKL